MTPLSGAPLSESAGVRNRERRHHPHEDALESPVLTLPEPNEPEPPSLLVAWGLARHLPQAAAQPAEALPDLPLMMPLGREHFGLPARKTSPTKVAWSLCKLSI